MLMLFLLFVVGNSSSSTSVKRIIDGKRNVISVRVGFSVLGFSFFFSCTSVWFRDSMHERREKDILLRVDEAFTEALFSISSSNSSSLSSKSSDDDKLISRKTLGVFR